MLMLKRLLRSEKMSQKDLAAQLGIDEASMSLIVNGRRDMSIEMRKAIDALFGADKVAQFDIQPITQPTQVQATIYPSGVIDDLREELRSELSHPKPEGVETIDGEEVELKETVILTPEIVNKEGIDIKKELKAGTLDAEVKPTQDVLPPHHAKVYTENDEMSPEVDANDPVFVRLLSSKHDFLNGRMYFVNLENGSVIRWVVRLDADNVRLISMKDEETVPMSAIKSISEVVAITKRPKTLPKERVTFDEAIARKDNQLDALLDQQSRLIDQQGRMIDLLEKKTN